MKAHSIVVDWLSRWQRNLCKQRGPDFIIGEDYLKRWYVIPRNKIFNIYLHLFTGSDDDRALHDHPWWSMSIALAGRMSEHTISEGGVHKQREVTLGDVIFRSAKFAHRLELKSDHAITLFITGPKFRHWGFHCQDGWVPWEEFVGAEQVQLKDEY